MWPVLLERGGMPGAGPPRELAAGERRAWHFRGSNGRLPMIMDDLGPAPAKRVEANIPV